MAKFVGENGLIHYTDKIEHLLLLRILAMVIGTIIMTLSLRKLNYLFKRVKQYLKRKLDITIFRLNCQKSLSIRSV